MTKTLLQAFTVAGFACVLVSPAYAGEPHQKVRKERESESHKPYDNRPGGGRVADKNKKTVYSPKQIDQLKKKSDERRGTDGVE